MEHILPDSNGEIFTPDAPGLGISVNFQGLQPYLREIQIIIDGETSFKSIPLADFSNVVA
jgi:hypothetical protein